MAIRSLSSEKRPINFSLPPTNSLRLRNLAKAGYLAIKKETGTKFRIGTVAAILKNTKQIGGGSLDYAHKMAKIPFVIALELSGGSFQPPEDQINSIIRESWIGIRAMCSSIKKNI